MDFWTYPTLYTTPRDKVSSEVRDLATFYSNAMADMVAQGDPIGFKQVDAEHKWLQDSRPYYRLYPGILEPLVNLARAWIPKPSDHLATQLGPPQISRQP